MKDVELFVVYDDADSQPHRFAVEKTLVSNDGLRCEERMEFTYLEQVRSMLAQRGLTRVPRARDDEPRLLETWL